MIKSTASPGGFSNTHLTNLFYTLQDKDVNTIYDSSLGPQHFWIDGYLQVADVSGQVWRAGDNITLVADASGVTLSTTTAFGQMAVHDSSTTVTIPSGLAYTLVAPWDLIDISTNCTIDGINGTLKPQLAGVYDVKASVSLSSATNNTILAAAIFVNEEEQNSLHFLRKISTAGDVGAASITGLVKLDADASISLRFRHDRPGAVDITVDYGNLSIHRVGD